MKNIATPVSGGGGRHSVALPEYKYPILIKQCIGLFLPQNVSKLESKEVRKKNRGKEEKRCSRQEVDKTLRREDDKNILVSKKKSLTNILTYSLVNFKKCAFTLAEVLITLGIIGIVAALTMPSLIAKYQEKETVARLKKAYSTVAQAYVMGQTMSGSISSTMSGEPYGLEGSRSLKNYFKPYLKGITDCEKYSDCADFDSADTFGETTSAIKLADGTLLSFALVSNDCSSDRGAGNLKETCGAIGVHMYPNKTRAVGKNYFQFYVTKRGIIPYGTKDETDWTFKRDCTTTGGYGCTAWVLINENLDYLHCDDLSWDDKTKCN